MDFKIESDVPIPSVGYIYPFAEMGVGDSFKIEEKDVHRIRAAATQFAKRNDAKFTTRKNGTDGYRCWRIK